MPHKLPPVVAQAAHVDTRPRYREHEELVHHHLGPCVLLLENQRLQLGNALVALRNLTPQLVTHRPQLIYLLVLSLLPCLHLTAFHGHVDHHLQHLLVNLAHDYLLTFVIGWKKTANIAYI